MEQEPGLMMEFLICLRISIGCDSVDRVYDFCGKHEKGQDEEGMVVRGILGNRFIILVNSSREISYSEVEEVV